MRRSICSIAVVGMVLFPGCFSNKARKVESEERASQPASEAVDERIAPATINYTFLDTINQGKELTLSDEDFGKGDQEGVTGSGSASAVPAVPETRYRVQVLASNRVETAREQKKELEKKISEPVVIGYEAPYYKLFAGSFPQRQDAQKTLLKLKKLGFTDAWIVSASVTPEN